MRKFTKSNKGFTIIEVMIVLAIAGLVMGIVFLAVPALQRNQRDTRRTNEVSRMKADLEAFSGSNNGRYPFIDTDGTSKKWDASYCTNYFSSLNIQDPSIGVKVDCANAGTQYLPNAVACGTASTAADPGCVNGQSPAAGVFTVIADAKCSGEKAIGATATTANPNNNRQFAVKLRMDRGNYLCVDNG